MATADIQIHRQFAAALMMPSPRRVNNAGISPQVLSAKEYVIERIHIDFTNHLLLDKTFVVPGLIETQNQAHEHAFPSQQRFALVKRVWENQSRFAGATPILGSPARTAGNLWAPNW